MKMKCKKSTLGSQLSLLFPKVIVCAPLAILHSTAHITCYASHVDHFTCGESWDDVVQIIRYSTVEASSGALLAYFLSDHYFCDHFSFFYFYFSFFMTSLAFTPRCLLEE